MKTLIQSKDMFYPPSILVIADDCRQVVKLKQQLINNGCQVYWTNTLADDRLRTARQKYFDLIVLNIADSAQLGYDRVTRKLTDWPELADLPLVLLTPQNLTTAARNTLASRPVYCVIQDTLAKANLLRVIEQIHYMTYRYV